MAKYLRAAAAVAALSAGMLLLTGSAAADEDAPGGVGADRRDEARTDPSDASTRSAYSYIRLITGDATVNSRWNGRVEARRNLPISTGDEILVSEAGRVEVGLADGNLLQIGGGTRAGFESLSAQQGEDDDVSAIRLQDGSLFLAATGRNEDEIPRIDTDDATIYVSPGSRARVNADSRRGTVVVDRYGTVEVHTPAGTYKLRAGQYLMVRGDEEPEIARGPFSRDRFDIWSADRLEALSANRIASARYVDQDAATDVESLDGYGDWSYSQTYQTDVWTPHVDIGWTPYGFGSWYYTPAGLTWLSSDPWGWYPFHYGNWFLEAASNRWCWAPASVYSPAWVYWAYTPNYVGWCPTGLISGFAPWGTYYGHSGWRRANLYLPIHGSFNPRQVNFRGWNFTGSSGFGSGMTRSDVIPGSRIAPRLGTSVAISSRPIVVHSRPGEAPGAVRDYIREAPRAIERASAGDSSRFAPILARDRTLPPASAQALREGTVVAERGRLAGAAAADLLPRAVTRVEQDSAARARGGESSAVRSGRTERGDERATAPRTAPAAPSASASDAWRSRGRSASPAVPGAAPAVSSDARNVSTDSRTDRGRAERDTATSSAADWRSKRPPREVTPEAVPGRSAREDDWRTREVPPARRVIEGAVPGRGRESETARTRTGRSDPAPRTDAAPRVRPDGPARAESRPAAAPRAETRSAPAAPRSSPPDRSRKD